MVVLNDTDETVAVLELPDDDPDALWGLILDLYRFEYDGSDAHFRPPVNAYLLAKKYGSKSLQRSVVGNSDYWIEILEECQQDDDIGKLAAADFEALKVLFENTADGDALRLEVPDRFAAMFEFLKARYPTQVQTLLTDCAVYDGNLGRTANLLP